MSTDQNAEFAKLAAEIRQANDATVAAIRADKQRLESQIGQSELSKAIAEHGISGPRAEQLSHLWRDQVVVDNAGDITSVRTRDYRPVKDFVATELAKDTYSHFRPAPPSTPGNPVNRPAPAAPEVPDQPRSLGEAFIANFQMQQRAREAGRVSADPRLDPSRAVGLRKNNANGPTIGGLLPGWSAPHH